MFKSSVYSFYVILLVFFLSFSATVFHYGTLNTEKSTHSPLFQKEGIGLLTITGPISAETPSSGFRADGFLDTLEKIYSFEKNPSIKALVVRINSPGGTVGSSQEIYQALLRLKKTRKIPIIVSMGDVTASGGFWIAMAGDTLFANPGSIVGNIGVIMQNFNLESVAEKLGVEVHVYKSGPYKDILSSFRSTSESEKDLVKQMIDNIHQQFVEVVRLGRQLDSKEIANVTDGRIFTGLQALEKGLIDKLGGLDDAISFAGEHTGLGRSPHVIEHAPHGMQQLFHFIQEQTRLQFQSVFNRLFQALPPIQTTIQ